MWQYLLSLASPGYGWSIRYEETRCWKVRVPSSSHTNGQCWATGQTGGIISLQAGRLGGWQLGEEATSQLLTLVSSRIKTLKQKQVIREDRNPTVPSLLLEKHDRYVEEEDRVKTSMFARCWRCKSLCQYCSKMMRRGPNFGNFRTE